MKKAAQTLQQKPIQPPEGGFWCKAPPTDSLLESGPLSALARD